MMIDAQVHLGIRDAATKIVAQLLRSAIYNMPLDAIVVCPSNTLPATVNSIETQLHDQVIAELKRHKPSFKPEMSVSVRLDQSHAYITVRFNHI